MRSAGIIAGRPNSRAVRRGLLSSAEVQRQMAELVGQTLSHYHVTSALGAGGMGEVYRATDTSLGREVAIKVLPAHVSQDAERLARFRREAHLLAALNHPNIAAIYGLEEANGTPFLALELVEGEDLRQRLARGAVPVPEALEIAEQVAEALEEAHNKGIVHRDLKPANVKLTSNGRVKVLDFGLAKAWADDSGGGTPTSPMLSQSPTFARTGTLAGLILGTAAYMSPEQARGKPVDRRTDVWAFGVLLWELLSGRPLFAGGTVTDVIAAVVTKEPDLSALPAETPPAVRRLMSRCLRKDPRMRLPDIGAARLELQELIAGTPSEGLTTAATDEASRRERHRHRRERWVWAALALGAVGLAAVFGALHLRRVDPPRIAARFPVDVPHDWELPPNFGWPVPSPDGRQIVFETRRTGSTGGRQSSMLWLRPLESSTTRPIAGTEGGGMPFWSPDGRELAFFTDKELRRLNLANGTIQRICALPRDGLGGADWSSSGTILFSTGAQEGQVYAVPAAGGEAKPITMPDRKQGEASHHMPQFLSGDRFLFLVGGEDRAAGTYVASLSAPADRRRVVPGWVRRIYADGHLLSVRDGALMAQPFDLDDASLLGDPVTIAPSVATWSINPGFGWFAVSPAGTLAYVSGGTVTGRVQLAWADRKGNDAGAIGAPGSFGQVALSPDERHVALEIADAVGRYDLWLMDVARGVTSRVTAAPGDERDPVWARDSRSLAFLARTEKGPELRRKGLRASDPERVLVAAPLEHVPESWGTQPDSLLVVRRNAETDEQSVWAVPVTGGDPQPVLTGFRLDEPQLSPDGRWLAYVSRESGEDEVYVEPFRREGERVRVSVAGGGQPKWRRDGRELFFTTPKNRLAAVEVRTAGDRLDVSLPTDLFEMWGIQGTGFDDYAPSADGQRFLVKRPLDEDIKPRIQVLTHWRSLLR